jgi:hypothetical protein
LPANIVLARVGAKRFVFSIMTLWTIGTDARPNWRERDQSRSAR